MGWGLEHTPFYVPDPRDPRDLAETAVSHALWGGASLGVAWAISGVYPGPGHLGTMWHAFFSRQHIGAAYAGTNAFDDTMFALRTYAKPFSPLIKAAGVVGAAHTFHTAGTWLEDQLWESVGFDPREELGAPLNFDTMHPTEAALYGNLR